MEIYGTIERKAESVWETLINYSDLYLYNSSKMFDILTFNDLNGREGIRQKPLRQWCHIVSEDTARWLFIRLNEECNFALPLMSRSMFDYGSFAFALNNMDIAPETLRKLHSGGKIFRLNSDIVSNPDFCHWNVCSADELEKAIRQYEWEYDIELGDNDAYLSTLRIMRQQEAEGYEVRFIYAYDEATAWLGKPYF